MKGLLVKDFELMKVQKTFFILLLGVGVLLNFSSSGSFSIGYFTFVCATFVTSTVSYDEFDRGLTFLMTLPVSRRTYAVSKYVFGGIVVAGAWLVGTIVATVCAYSRGEGFRFMVEGLFMLPMGLLVVAAMLPFMIKFGQEKGRYVSLGVFGAVFAIAFIIDYLYKNATADIAKLISFAGNLGVIPLALLVIALSLVLYVLSCGISIKIMEKKEL